jgi:hypothetical protein
MEAFKGDGHNPQVPNLLKGVLIGRDVYRFEGARALFKGLGPTLSGVVPARYPPRRNLLFNDRGRSTYTPTPTPNVSSNITSPPPP